MKVFDKRPLSLILCILLGAFVFFASGDKTVRIVIISLSAALALIPIFLKELSKSQKLKLVLCSFLVLFASLLSYLYFDLWYYADNRFDEKCEIVGTVEEFNFDKSTKTLVLSTDSINEKAFSHYKIKVLLENNDTTNITIGTKIGFTANLDSFESTADFDSAAYYYSRGFSASASNIENLTVIEQSSESFFYKIAQYRKSLSRKLVLHSNSESGGLLSALLLGEREFLSGQIRLDFSRIGISHILALSGMHLAILCYGFSHLLSMMRVSKKWRKLSEILFAILYMGLTGFPVSVMRSGLMLIISSLLFLLASSKDSLTNLFLSVTVIILIQPYSVFDISLWLSAFATLGIVIFSELTEKGSCEPQTHQNVFLTFLAPILSSVFAISSTVLLSHIYFKSISLVSLISTFVFSPIILVFMYIGTFYLFTASFIPIGGIIKAFGNVIIELAHSASSVKFALVSTDFWLTKALIIISTLFLFFFLVLDIKRKKSATVILSVLLIASISSAGIYTATKARTFDFVYTENDERERILMKSKSETTLIEISTPTKSLSYETLSYLEGKDILYLDNYFITNYSNNVISSIEIMLSGIYVENIYVPAPKSQEHKLLYSEILKLKDRYRIKIIPYLEEEMLAFSDFTVFPIFYDKNGKFAMTAYYDDQFYTYLTADMLRYDTASTALNIMNGAKTVIIGAKGHLSENYKFIYKLPKDTKLIYNKKTGLAEEILDYYENNITVDPSGSIDLYVE